MDAGAQKHNNPSRVLRLDYTQMGCNKSQATTILYQRLSLSLVRANARALLSRARFQQSEEGVEACGCGVVAAVTLILLVCCTVHVLLLLIC